MQRKPKSRSLGKEERERIWAATYAAAFVAGAREAARVSNTTPLAAADSHDFAEEAEGLAERAVEQYERWLREGKA